MNRIYIKKISAWAEGLNSPLEWKEWAQGKRCMLQGGKGPELPFTEPMFRRRLSCISKMTIKVVHDIMPLLEDTKLFFVSERGEIARQFQINKTLIEENTISPAAFSLSVFNAPPALASMALGLKGGYCAVYPKENSFTDGIKAAAASLLYSQSEEIVFVYADEEIPCQYENFSKENPPAAAFALLLSKSNHDCIPLPLPEENDTPFSFLKKIIGGNIDVNT